MIHDVEPLMELGGIDSTREVEPGDFHQVSLAKPEERSKAVKVQVVDFKTSPKAATPAARFGGKLLFHLSCDEP